MRIVVWVHQAEEYLAAAMAIHSGRMRLDKYIIFDFALIPHTVELGLTTQYRRNKTVRRNNTTPPPDTVKRWIEVKSKPVAIVMLVWP